MTAVACLRAGWRVRGCEKVGKLADPAAEVACRYAKRVVFGVRENAENTIRKEICDGVCHTGEPVEEELSGAGAERAEGGAHALRGIRPGVIVIQPATRLVVRRAHRGGNGGTHMLIKTMPRDQTSAARGI